VPGLLPMVLAFARRGVARVVVPADCADEARLVGGMEVMAVASISEAVDALRSRRRAPPRQPDRVELATSQGPGSSQPTGPAGPPSLAIPIEVPDLADVRGQVEARRALEVALAGGHGLLLIGPPGTGKTLMARTITSLLPPLGDEEAFAATIVASMSGEGPIHAPVRTAPFRSPHHTVSDAALDRRAWRAGDPGALCDQWPYATVPVVIKMTAFRGKLRHSVHPRPPGPRRATGETEPRVVFREV
jgi:magnesium chelatase family protein